VTSFAPSQFIYIAAIPVIQSVPAFKDSLESFRYLRYRFVGRYLGMVVSRNDPAKSYGQCACELYGWTATPPETTLDVSWRLQELNAKIYLHFRRGDCVVVPVDDITPFEDGEDVRDLVHVL
jgi:hypothetical protein